MARREQEQEELQREREEEEKAPELAAAAVVPPLKSYPAGSVMVQHKQRLGTPLVVAMSEAPPPQSALECEPSDAQGEAPMPMPILTVPMQVRALFPLIVVRARRPPKPSKSCLRTLSRRAGALQPAWL